MRVRRTGETSYLDGYGIIEYRTTFNIVPHCVIAHQGDILLPLADIVVCFLQNFFLSKIID
jgi:hypothetical protein